MAAEPEPDRPVNAAPQRDTAGRWVLRNEFSAVEVQLDLEANSPRLKITDLRTDRTGYLDPLELERLTVARHTDLAWIVSPTNGDTEHDIERDGRVSKQDRPERRGSG